MVTKILKKKIDSIWLINILLVINEENRVDKENIWMKQLVTLTEGPELKTLLFSEMNRKKMERVKKSAGATTYTRELPVLIHLWLIREGCWADIYMLSVDVFSNCALDVWLHHTMDNHKADPKHSAKLLGVGAPLHRQNTHHANWIPHP